MEKLLTAPELAVMLGVALKTVYKWSHEKKLPPRAPCRLLRFRASDVERWLSSPAIPAAPKPSSVGQGKKRGRPRKSQEIDEMVARARAEVL